MLPESETERPLPRWRAALVGAFTLLSVALAGLLVARMLQARRGNVRRGEARIQLLTLAAAQKSYHEQHGHFAATFPVLDLPIERGNRYAYFLAERGPIEARAPEAATPPLDAVVLGVDRLQHPEAAPITDWRATRCPLSTPHDVKGRPLGLGVHGVPPEDLFVIGAAANLDADPALDCWSLSSVQRHSPEGEVIPAGLPWRESGDLPGSLWESLTGQKR